MVSMTFSEHRNTGASTMFSVKHGIQYDNMHIVIYPNISKDTGIYWHDVNRLRRLQLKISSKQPCLPDFHRLSTSLQPVPPVSPNKKATLSPWPGSGFQCHIRCQNPEICIGDPGMFRLAPRTQWHVLPSGKLLHNYGKSPCCYGKTHYFNGHVQ